VEPVANGAKKPEEQEFDPSRSKELLSDVPLLRFCRFCICGAVGWFLVGR
jgi:hypothetical protein